MKYHNTLLLFVCFIISESSFVLVGTNKMADSKIKMAPAGRKLAIVCGVEQATLLLDKFGPGGTSRCIQHPMVKNHLLNPIEFTALGTVCSSTRQKPVKTVMFP